MLLKTEDLCVKYDDLRAVSGVSFEVGEGSFVSVLGANGAGKTTLLNTIAGLTSPSSGKVYFDGKDVTGASPEKMVKYGLSLVPQGGRVFGRMSVEDNLLIGSYKKAARRGAAERLGRVYELFPDLKKLRKYPAGSLSGGQRQMTAIGRALMSEPKLLVFDELSLGLAPVVVKEIYAVIKRIRDEQNMTIILVEQDTKRAVSMTEYTYIMLKGQIVLGGRSAELSEEDVKKAYFGLKESKGNAAAQGEV